MLGLGVCFSGGGGGWGLISTVVAAIVQLLIFCYSC